MLDSLFVVFEKASSFVLVLEWKRAEHMIIGWQASMSSFIYPGVEEKDLVLVCPYADNSDLRRSQVNVGRVSSISPTQKEEPSVHFHPLHHWTEAKYDCGQIPSKQKLLWCPHCCCSVAKSCLTLCDPMDHVRIMKHAKLPCPSLSPQLCSKSSPLSQWCHSTISSSVAPFSTCSQS